MAEVIRTEKIKYDKQRQAAARLTVDRAAEEASTDKQEDSLQFSMQVNFVLSNKTQ